MFLEEIAQESQELLLAYLPRMRLPIRGVTLSRAFTDSTPPRKNFSLNYKLLSWQNLFF